MNIPEKYNSTLRYIYDLQLFGIKVGLNNIQSILEFLGHPEYRFPSIHIAGTNGKGSTASMIASILTASGYKTGLYTSPHLVDFSERIRIDGKKILPKEIIYYSKLIRKEVEVRKATFFEATTAIAFQYFADQNVDIAIIETGLGGRWDATNVITPVLSIITNIGIEHTEYLGKTCSSIASEKGGIIKPFIPVLTAVENVDALKQLTKKSTTNSSQLRHIRGTTTVKLKEHSIEGLLLDLKTDIQVYDDLFVSLSGEHQINNLRLAVSAVEYLKSVEHFLKISKTSIRKGLSSIAHYSGLRGRLDLLKKAPVVIADVAHNPSGIYMMTCTLRKILVGKLVLVFGVMKDKNYQEMIRYLKPLVRLAITVAPETERALPSKLLTREFHCQGIQAYDAGSVISGYKRGISECRPDENILICGSHYVIGGLYKYLKINL